MFTAEEEQKYRKAFSNQDQFSFTEYGFANQGLDIIDLDTWGEEKPESSLPYLEYAYSNLSSAAQKLLLCLAEFNKFIDKSDIPNYIEQLKIFEPLQDYPFDQFNAAIQQGIKSRLLAAMDDDGRFLMIHPELPDFLQSQLDRNNQVIRSTLREGFKNHYQGLAISYQHLMESQDDEERELGLFFCRLEYENLYNALQICLDKQAGINIYFCLDKYLESISDRASNLKLAELVCQHLEKYPNKFIKSKLGYQVAFAIEKCGSYQLDAKQYQKARKSYEKTLKIYAALENVEDKQKQIWQAAAYHQLGRVYQELGDYPQAKRNFQQALDINIKYGVSEALSSEARYECAGTYNQLGIVAQALGEYAQARQNFQQALEIFSEYGDSYECARTHHLLGIVAQQLGEYEPARSHYQQALDIFDEIGVSEALPGEARNFSARTYHNLGSIAQKLQEYEQARQNYQQALDIKIASGDRQNCAGTYFQLGRVAEELGELEAAKANYLQALQITTEFSDRHNLEICLRNLTRFFQVTQDESLLVAMSEILGVSVEEILNLSIVNSQ
ncbi:tetratricopeptide repeat protein [Calothrix sp. FACHB-1219]|uniref:tetratricopeptide repeat protein n=1 Tax=unclassified Calothrix TaxID=2619626 RepID=UPI00168284B8|nr:MULTISPECIES: tetratricopeptide repeat protein [unclassified Calothrix]MBD2206542.1 tetratricopeptide repeat protein [Calothrix sp. FACHB-168]MBD2221338.1 tetratricopeptide repeat protein [Calothrix sp. FACHB-1219]